MSRQPVLYWMSKGTESNITVSIMGMDPTLETMTDEVLSLCLQAARFKGTPSWRQPFLHVLVDPLGNVE